METEAVIPYLLTTWNKTLQVEVAKRAAYRIAHLLILQAFIFVQPELMDSWPLLPLSHPPFAGKSPHLAESWMHCPGSAPILALGQGNGPSGGEHGGAASILKQPEIHRRSASPRAWPCLSLRQSGGDCGLYQQFRRHFSARSSGNRPCTRPCGNARR